VLATKFRHVTAPYGTKNATKGEMIANRHDSADASGPRDGPVRTLLNGLQIDDSAEGTQVQRTRT